MNYFWKRRILYCMDLDVIIFFPYLQLHWDSFWSSGWVVKLKLIPLSKGALWTASDSILVGHHHCHNSDWSLMAPGVLKVAWPPCTPRTSPGPEKLELPSRFHFYLYSTNGQGNNIKAVHVDFSSSNPSFFPDVSTFPFYHPIFPLGSNTKFPSFQIHPSLVFFHLSLALPFLWHPDATSCNIYSFFFSFGVILRNKLLRAERDGLFLFEAKSIAGTAIWGKEKDFWKTRHSTIPIATRESGIAVWPNRCLWKCQHLQKDYKATSIGIRGQGSG